MKPHIQGRTETLLDVLCQQYQLSIDEIYNHLGDKILGLTVRKCLDWINQSEKTHPKHGGRAMGRLWINQGEGEATHPKHGGHAMGRLWDGAEKVS